MLSILGIIQTLWVSKLTVKCISISTFQDIEHVAVYANTVLTTSFDGLSVLWELLSGKILLKITRCEFHYIHQYYL